MPTEPQDPDELAFLASYDASAYPHPSVAVDVVLLTVADGVVRTLLLRRPRQPQQGRWALPGAFVGMDESLDAAAGRVLASKAGLDAGLHGAAVHVRRPGPGLAHPRDQRRVLRTGGGGATGPGGRLARSMAALMLADVVCPADGEDGEMATLEVRDAGGQALALAFDHARILATAIERIRGKLDYAPIGFELLPATFTLRDLRLVHEAILGHPLNKDSFRRKVLDRGLVEATGDRLEGVGHRPPELYRFARAARPGAR